MLVYGENPKEYMYKLLELINKHNNVFGEKVNKQNLSSSYIPAAQIGK